MAQTALRGVVAPCHQHPWTKSEGFHQGIQYCNLDIAVKSLDTQIVLHKVTTPWQNKMEPEFRTKQSELSNYVFIDSKPQNTWIQLVNCIFA